MSSGGIDLTGWQHAIRVVNRVGNGIDRAIRKALKREAQFFRTKIVQGIREQAPGGIPFAPLSANTLKTRALEGFRGKKALIRTGELRNAVVVVETEEGVFIGVLRTARNRSGQSLANVADIQENGAGPFIVPITLRSRHYLGAAGVNAPGPGRFVIIRIPPRPFIRPVFDKWGSGSQVKDRVLRSVAESFKGELGIL